MKTIIKIAIVMLISPASLLSAQTNQQALPPDIDPMSYS